MTPHELDDAICSETSSNLLLVSFFFSMKLSSMLVQLSQTTSKHAAFFHSPPQSRYQSSTQQLLIFLPPVTPLKALANIGGGCATAPEKGLSPKPKLHSTGRQTATQVESRTGKIYRSMVVWVELIDSTTRSPMGLKMRPAYAA